MQQRKEIILMHIPKCACTDQPSWIRMCTAEWLVDICNIILSWQSTHKLHTCQSRRSCTRDSPCSMQGRGNNHISVEKEYIERVSSCQSQMRMLQIYQDLERMQKNSSLTTSSVFILSFLWMFLTVIVIPRVGQWEAWSKTRRVVRIVLGKHLERGCEL